MEGRRKPAWLLHLEPHPLSRSTLPGRQVGMGVDPIPDVSAVYYEKVQDVNQLPVLTAQIRNVPFVQSTNVRS